MAGDSRAHACFANDAERCAAKPLAQEDAMDESGCVSAPHLSVPLREPEQAQEVEAIAALARGIGHDFNNLLSIITTYTLLVLEDLRPDDPLRPDLEEVCRAAERAHVLAGQLSALGHQGCPARGSAPT